MVPIIFCRPQLRFDAAVLKMPPVKRAGNRASKSSKVLPATTGAIGSAGPVSLCDRPDNVWNAFSTPAKILLLKYDSCVVVVVDGVDDDVNEANIASTVVGLLVRSLKVVVLGVVVLVVVVSNKVEVGN